MSTTLAALEPAPKAKRAQGERCCEPVVYVVPGALDELSGWLS